MPAIIVGTARIATHAEIRRMSAFWRTVTCVRFACSALPSRSRKPSTRLPTRSRGGLTSREEVARHVAEVVAHLGRDEVEVAARQPVDRRGERPNGPLHLEHLALEAVDP